MKLFVVLAVFLVSATAGHAAASAAWTPAVAESRLKATYRTVDPVRLANYQERLDAMVAAGIPETDAGMIRARQYVEDAKTGAVVASAKCAGAGRAVRGRYGRFHCTAKLTGSGSYTGDYSATKRLTVVVTGASSFTVRAGWR